MLFVTEEIIDWYKEYEYNKEFGTSLVYEKQSSRYLEAWLVYKYFRELYDYDITLQKIKKTKKQE